MAYFLGLAILLFGISLSLTEKKSASHSSASATTKEGLPPLNKKRSQFFSSSADGHEHTNDAGKANPVSKLIKYKSLFAKGPNFLSGRSEVEVEDR